MGRLSEFSNASDIRNRVASKARAYVPEWKFAKDDPDGGTAVALCFCDMFGETVERLERVPYKYFMHFLNMLQINVKSVSPATGLANFTLADNSTASTQIPAGTQMFADVITPENESMRIVFETENEITAVPSTLMGLYNVDPVKDIINKVDYKSGNARLFCTCEESNIQKHRFAIWHDNVLDITHPASVSIKIEGSAAVRHHGDTNIRKLSDPNHVTWKFVSGETEYPVDGLHFKDGMIRFDIGRIPSKPSYEFSEQPAEFDDDIKKHPHLVCDMHTDDSLSGIITDAITVGSRFHQSTSSPEFIEPDRVYYNDISLKRNNPGYLFGTEPGKYDTLLISNDEVLCKRGARINITLVMHTVVKEKGEAPAGPVYDWDGRLIIEKSESKTITPDNIYISEIVWEYWNDVGWAHLEVEGTSVNPFRSSEPVRHESISFTCPADMAKSHQNSVWGYWLRARIINIENPYSSYGRWQLPFAESIGFEYDYGTNLQKAKNLLIENNAESVLIGEMQQSKGMSLYCPLKYPQHAVYLAFDIEPKALPLSIFMGFAGASATSRTLSFERLSKDVSGGAVFRECKALDGTDGFRDSGVLSLYVAGDMARKKLFGLEAFWLRIVDKGLKYKDNEGTAEITDIEINAAEIVQKQTVNDEHYSTELFESGKTITLMNKPILNCEVFVDELTSFENPQEIQGAVFEYDDDGSLARAWVKWDTVATLDGRDAQERIVKVDYQSGVLTFGNSVNGRVPPQGTNNICVNYSYGGGKAGNLPKGTITGLVSGISGITAVTNFIATGGGSNLGDIHQPQRAGPARLSHRNRAVTLNDFEHLILEEFPDAVAVKAFAGIDPEGKTKNGAVTVAILSQEVENRGQVLKLCRNAYTFLAEKAHTELVGSGKLAVVPASVITVNVMVDAVAEDIAHGAQTERNIEAAISNKLSCDTKQAIGNMPSVADIFDCLRNIPNLLYVQRVSLEGEYMQSGKRIYTPLDKPGQFPFAGIRSGTHTVRFE